MSVDVGEFDRRIARAHQIDRQIFARSSQIAGIAFDRAEKPARGGGKAFDTLFQRPVTRPQDRIFHAAQIGLGLVHGTRDPVGLELIHPLHPLVAQWIKPERAQMQRRPCKRKQDRIDHAGLPGHRAQAQTDASQHCGKNLARNRRTAGNALVVIGRLGQHTITGQPGRQKQRGRGAEAKKQSARVGGERRDQKGKRQRKHCIHPKPQPGRPFAVKRIRNRRF